MMALLSAVVRWSLRHRPAVLLAVLVLVAAGAHAAVNLTLDAVPDVTTVQVQVVTSAPALSPVEVEKYVSIPVERAMAGIPRVVETRSLSKYGISLVTVVFADGTDVYFARQRVSERMSEAQEAVPARYGKPALAPLTSGLGEIYQFVVSNPSLTPMQLEELLDWTIAPQLRNVPGVVEVNSLGGENRQYEVLLDPLRLQATGISVSEVDHALERSNANAGGGYFERHGEYVVIGSEGLVRNLDDLRSVVVGTTLDGTPITLATVGDVRFAPKLRRGAASMNGQGEVVVGVALMLLGESSLAVTTAVKAKLAALQPSLPPGTTLEPFYDRSELVNRTIRTVSINLLEGALLVILVLLLLLGDLRAGVVVALTIPLSLAFAIIVMHSLGLSGNLMSLGAIDFGLIVDGAVIVVENAVRWMSRRSRELGRELTADERLQSIEGAAIEVRTASVFGEAIIAIVYVPLLTLVGIEGKLFRPMATTVLLSLIGAFFLSLTVVPVLTSYIVRGEAHQPTWLLRKLQDAYERVLPWAMSRTRALTGAAFVVLLGSLWLGIHLGAEFVPQLDEGDLLIESRGLPSVGLTESLRLQERLQRAALRVPEVEQVVSKIGAPELALDPMGIEQADVYLALKPQAKWRSGVDKAAVAQQVHDEIRQSVPELRIALSQPIQMRTNELIAGTRSDVALIIYGADFDELSRLGAAAGDALKHVPGVVDVRVEVVSGLSYLRIVPDRSKLARHGLSIDDVNQLTETMAVGHVAGAVLEADKRFDIVVKTNAQALESLPLKGSGGHLLPLGDVAELRMTEGPAEVNRSQQSRRLTVEMNVRGRDLVSAVQEAQAAVRQQVPTPVGYRFEWGGQFQHYYDARARLMFVVPLALALIASLLWSALRSSRAAALILLNVPFAVSGGVVALFLRGLPFSISAGVGFVALFGVSVLNGLVLVSFARDRQERGADAATAIDEAARLRLRPVLMTALVAALGFLPMAVSTAPGSEVQRPLATVVIAGLFTATFLTLVGLPALYRRWFA